uniref:ABC transporter domain-containing protein n=1 Tax=Parastrongyloides trichosuri TaxID=131310 RepID=A0A0N4Z6E9_PARTI
MFEVGERLSQYDALHKPVEILDFFKNMQLEGPILEELKTLPNLTRLSIYSSAKGFANEKELLKSEYDLNKIFGIVIFDNKFAEKPKMVNEIKYKIRMMDELFTFSPTLFMDNEAVKKTDEIFVRYFNDRPLEIKDVIGKGNTYWVRGFLTLQKAVDSSIEIYIKNNYSESSLTVFEEFLKTKALTSLQRFPSFAYKPEVEKYLDKYSSASFVMLILTVISIVKTLVREKEMLLNEFMKVMDIVKYEFFDGMHWYLMWKPFSPEYEYLYGYHILSYLLNITILFLLSNYIEAVNPFGYGIPQSLYYFILPSYWFPSFSRKNMSEFHIEDSTQLGTGEGSSTDIVENETQSDRTVSIEEDEKEDSKPLVVIKNLTKVYEFNLLTKIKNLFIGNSSKKEALNEISLKLYENKITVILGHNGSGKTTIFSILCGIIPPTSGTIFIDGYDIRTHIDEIRKNFGFCPQHNILIDTFTVMEHLIFFCKLKGSEFDKDEAMRLLEGLKMDFKVNSYAGKLSGGQKRKLCLAIALIGNSKFVILDEPSSGLDPSSRHDIWSLIRKEKKDRTILLTTHYMEEADVLGDKICILANGELLCTGSSMYLKRAYGKGYEVTVVHNKTVLKKNMVKENNDNLLQFFQTYFPDVECSSAIGEEVKFVISRKYKSEFSGFFKALEEMMNYYNVFSFGVSVTTLEEVFLKRFIFVYRNIGYIFISIIMPILILLFLSIINVEKLIQLGSLNLEMKEKPAFKINSLDYYKNYFTNPYILFDKNSFSNDMSKMIKKLHPNVNQMFTSVPATDSNSSIFFPLIKKLTKRVTYFFTPIGFSSCDKNVILPASESDISKKITIYNGLFNEMMIHSKPLALNFIDTYLLRKETGNERLTITTINHPLPTISQPDRSTYFEIKEGTQGVVKKYLLPLAIVVSSVTIFLLREKCGNSRRLQMLAGIKYTTYYLTTFVWDYLHYIVIAVCVIICMKYNDIQPFTKKGTDILTVLFLMILFGMSGILFNYILHYFFNSTSQGFLVALVINYVIPLVLELFITFGELLMLAWNGQNRYKCINANCNNPNILDMVCCKKSKNSLYVNYILINPTKKGLLLEVLIFCLQIMFYIGVLHGIEIGFFRKYNIFKGKDICDKEDYVGSSSKSKHGTKCDDEDYDIKCIKKYVNTEDPSKHSIIVNDVKKCFRKVQAVRGITFYVDPKQCFGLLGVNGAGKTSTFKMLSGECFYCKGEVFIDGVNLKCEWNNINSSIGYCPQIDATIMEMTCEEILYMYGRIYGMEEEDIRNATETIIDVLDIKIHCKKQIKNLSGGNKRKVSIAIAVISMPEILLLDEPTAGVDPISKRLAWNILSIIRDIDSAIVLTTHSMNECEAICTSLAIMIDGKFKCYGSTQALKSKYGSIFNLLVGLKDYSMNNDIIKKISEVFPDALLVENHSTKLHFKLPKRQDTKYSDIFESLEGLVEPFKILDYNLSQTTLEEVFIQFSKSNN